jgi:hypothetical protein
MKHKLTNIKYGFLSLTGIVLLSGALWHVAVVPTSQACGSNPNCQGWAVTGQPTCDGACSCAGGWFISYTCYKETGVCNADGSSVVYTHCYEGGCCCPSGNCAGQGGGGGGGGGGEGGGDFCWSSWDCFAGEYCDGGTGTCYEYGSGPGGLMPE